MPTAKTRGNYRKLTEESDGVKVALKELATEACIVNSTHRHIQDMGTYYYVWIPLSEEEKKELKPNTKLPCWRIRLEKVQYEQNPL